MHEDYNTKFLEECSALNKLKLNPGHILWYNWNKKKMCNILRKVFYIRVWSEICQLFNKLRYI